MQFSFVLYICKVKKYILFMTIEQQEISQFRFGTVAKLAKTHGVSRQTVYNSLKFIYNTEKAQAIRRDCIDNYGARIVKTTINA